MGVRKGGNEHSLPLDIGTKKQNFLENLTSAAPFRLIYLFLAMTVYQPVRNSRCTRASFTVVVSCSAELAVYSRPLLCPQRQVAKLARDCFAVGHYCVTTTWQQIFQCSLQVTIFKRFSAPASCDCWAQTGNASRQWLLIAVSTDTRKR